MYTQQKNTSSITAILPERFIQRTLETLREAEYDVMHWNARGSLQDKRWISNFFPPISPEKGILRIIVPNDHVERVMETIIEKGHLHQQGTGAVYSTPCDELHIGGTFHSNCIASSTKENESTGSLKENLDVIQCIVSKDLTERVANAAINAGSHGPIVSYSEGRGLRDRLGWLRITKQDEKEVLTVIVDNADANTIFEAMGNAGKFDLPGRGFMYQMPVDKGLFNLPSQFDAQKHTANMQQIIGALDQLMGHENWRDQSVFSVGGTGKTAGLGFLKKEREQTSLNQQVCLTAIASREHTELVMDMMLDAGAPGVSTKYCQYLTPENECLQEGVHLVQEYGNISCIVSDNLAHTVLAQVKLKTEQLGIEDLCLYLQPVPRVMTYIHHPQPEQRRNANERALAY